jgi:hypothetical protein
MAWAHTGVVPAPLVLAVQVVTPLRGSLVAVAMLLVVGVRTIGVEAQKHALFIVWMEMRWQPFHPRPVLVILIPVVPARDIEVDVDAWVVIVVIPTVGRMPVMVVVHHRRCTASEPHVQDDQCADQQHKPLAVHVRNHGHILFADSERSRAVLVAAAPPPAPACVAAYPAYDQSREAQMNGR